METSTLFITSLIGLAIWCFVLINIIEKASRSKQIDQRLEIQSSLIAKMLEQMEMQTLLLSNMAAKEGIDDDTIKKILKQEIIQS